MLCDCDATFTLPLSPHLPSPLLAILFSTRSTRYVQAAEGDGAAKPDLEKMFGAPSVADGGEGDIKV